MFVVKIWTTGANLPPLVVTSAGVSRESRTSWSYPDHSSFSKFEGIEEETLREKENRQYEHWLYRNRLSVLLHSEGSTVERRRVNVEQLIKDIESVGLFVSRTASLETKLAARAHLTG